MPYLNYYGLLWMVIAVGSSITICRQKGEEPRAASPGPGRPELPASAGPPGTAALAAATAARGAPGAMVGSPAPRGGGVARGPAADNAP